MMQVFKVKKRLLNALKNNHFFYYYEKYYKNRKLKINNLNYF